MARPHDPDDDDGFVPPLPPEDRLWRHPSELAGSTPPRPPEPPAASASPTTPEVSDAPRGRTVVLAMAAGAVATIALLALVGTFERPSTQVAIEQVAVALPNGGQADPVDVLGGSLARVDAVSATATRTASGVVYRTDGYVLTTAATVSDAEQIVVTLADGRVLDAQLVGVDDVSGVAVVGVPAGELPAAVLADVDHVAPGDAVVSVSYPPDTAGSAAVSAGHVNGVGWRVDTPEGTWHDLIGASFDAAPTTPGAIVCDDSGAVMGLVLTAAPGEDETATPITTTPADQSDARADDTTSTTTPGMLVHYAAPIDEAVAVADELVATGRATHAWLGVMADDLDPETATELGRAGATLTEIRPDSPAAAADLRPGDVVLALDDTEVLSVSSLVVAIRAHDPGDPVRVTVQRGEERLDLPVTLGAHG